MQNSDASKSSLEHDQNLGDPSKYLDMQRMLIEQGNDFKNDIMTLKMCEYERALTERYNTIKSLHTVLANSNQNMNITER